MPLKLCQRGLAQRKMSAPPSSVGEGNRESTGRQLGWPDLCGQRGTGTVSDLPARPENRRRKRATTNYDSRIRRGASQRRSSGRSSAGPEGTPPQRLPDEHRELRGAHGGAMTAIISAGKRQVLMSAQLSMPVSRRLIVRAAGICTLCCNQTTFCCRASRGSSRTAHPYICTSRQRIQWAQPLSPGGQDHIVHQKSVLHACPVNTLLW